MTTIIVNNTLPTMTTTTTTSTKIKTEPRSPSSDFNNDETEAANALVSCAFTATILQQKSSLSFSSISVPKKNNKNPSTTEKKRRSSNCISTTTQPPKVPTSTSSTTTTEAKAKAKATMDTFNSKTAKSPTKINAPMVNKRPISIVPPTSGGASTSLSNHPHTITNSAAPPPRLATLYPSIPRTSVATTPSRNLQTYAATNNGATCAWPPSIPGIAQQQQQQTGVGMLHPNPSSHPAGVSMSVLPNPQMLHTPTPVSSIGTIGLPTPSQSFMTSSFGTTMNSQPEPQQQQKQQVDPRPPAPADFIVPQPQEQSPAEQPPQQQQQQQGIHQRTLLREARENYILYKDSSATRKRKTPTTSSDSVMEERQNENSFATKLQRNNNHNTKQTIPSLKYFQQQFFMSATTKESPFVTALQQNEQQQFTEALSSCKSTSHRNMIQAQRDFTLSSQRLYQAQDAWKEAQQALEDVITTFKQKERHCEYATRMYANEEFQSFQRITTKRSTATTTNNKKKPQYNSGGTCNIHTTSTGLTLSKEDIAWWKNYQQLKEYYIQNGHMQLPREKGPLLTWLNRQREAARTLTKEDAEGEEGYFYRNTTEGETTASASAHTPQAIESSRPISTCWSLEPHKVIALDDLGIDWDPTTTTWMRHYQELLEYKQRTGHVFIDRDEQFRLWKWMNSQQVLYKHKRLTNSKMKLLEKVGVLWTHRFRPNDLIMTAKANAGAITPVHTEDHQKNDYHETEKEAWKQEIKTKREQALWNQRYGELTMFKLAHGHCQVPKDFPSNRKLAKWVEKQNDFFRRCGLSNSGNSSTPVNNEALKGQNKQRYQKLLVLGFGSPSPQSSHQQQNPHQPTSASTATKSQQKKHEQSEQVAATSLFPQQKKQHQKCLRLSPSSPPLSKAPVTSARTAAPTQKTYWDERFCELLGYKRAQGDCLVPRKTTGGLGEWVDLQRQHYRKLKRGEKACLDQDQKRRLDEIGFIWDPYTHTWDKRFKELIAYKAKYGNCNVPTHHHHRKNPGYPVLSEFVRKQREEYRKLQEGKESLMTHEHITVLEAIGFTWKMHANLPWGERFKQMLSFKEKHGSCKVPKPKSEDEEYVALYKWAKRQRYQYYLFQKGEHSKMTQEQIELLEGIGFSLRPSGKAFERPRVAGFCEQQPPSILASDTAIHTDAMKMSAGSINSQCEIDMSKHTAADVPSVEQQSSQGNTFAEIASKS